MTQMDVVRALPVEVSRVGRGQAVIRHDKFKILTVTADGMALDGSPIDREQLANEAAGIKIVLRISRDIPTQETVGILAVLADAGAEVSIEVEQTEESNTE